MNQPCAPTEDLPRDGALAEAVAEEILALLRNFAVTGETGAVDLGGLPLSPRDRETLDEILGRGEVSAEIEVAGRSEVWETAFSGVWRVRHWGDGSIAADLVEIVSCPEILRTDRRDARAAALRLEAALEERNAATAEISHET